jgi:hypothetical protein
MAMHFIKAINFLEYMKQDKFANGSCKITIKMQVRFSGSTRGKMRQAALNCQANVEFPVKRGMRIRN